MFEENVATKMRPLAPANMPANDSPTWRSLAEKPLTSMFVDSHTNSSTPARPISAMRCRLMMPPSMGV